MTNGTARPKNRPNGKSSRHRSGGDDLLDTSKNLLIVFAKTPEAGRVKRRLSPPLSEEEAAALQAAMLLDVLSLTDNLSLPRLLACTPKTDHPFFDLCTRNRTLLRRQQEGETLGERMRNALAWAFGEGFSRVVLIGCDSPDLPLEFIREGFRRLRTVSCVVGPTDDGGYYLVGARDRIPPIFDDIPWGSSEVMRATLRHLDRHAISHRLLPPWYDIDRPDDLARLAEQVRHLIAQRQPHPEKTSDFIRQLLPRLGRADTLLS